MHLKLTTSSLSILSTVVIIFTSMPVFSQSGGTGFQLEEIVVTARKREESVSDVPSPSALILPKSLNTGKLIQRIN